MSLDFDTVESQLRERGGEILDEPEAVEPPDAYAAIDAVNWSTLVHMATSPRMLAWRVDHPRSETRALRLGSAIHCATLEPEAWESRYVVQPAFNRRTKLGKLAHAEWCKSLAPGATVLSAGEYETLVRCVDSVRAHPAASDLLSHGRAEEVLTWTDASTGLRCKGRVDYITTAYLLDVKSTRADTLRALSRELADRLYHGQVAFYLDGARAMRLLPEPCDVFVVAVQTSPPYDVIPARLSYEDIERGRQLYRSLLRRYAECRAANWWPGLAPGVIDLSLPAWASSGEPEENGDEW
jgi:exodeoxyribonuclease VIII